MSAKRLTMVTIDVPEAVRAALAEHASNSPLHAARALRRHLAERGADCTGRDAIEYVKALRSPAQVERFERKQAERSALEKRAYRLGLGPDYVWNTDTADLIAEIERLERLKRDETKGRT